MVGEVLTLGAGLTIDLKEVIPFADYEIRKMTVTKVRYLNSS